MLILWGLALVLLDPSISIAYGFIVLGLYLAFAILPISLRHSMRVQHDAVKDGGHITLEDECLKVAYPLSDSRLRWAGLRRVVETADAWYVMLGPARAVTIPKSVMTEEQRAQFAAFVKQLRPSPARA